jgi:hypothetical protein
MKDLGIKWTLTATGGGSLASDNLYLLDLRNGEQMA